MLHCRTILSVGDHVLQTDTSSYACIKKILPVCMQVYVYRGIFDSYCIPQADECTTHNLSECSKKLDGKNHVRTNHESISYYTFSPHFSAFLFKLVAMSLIASSGFVSIWKQICSVLPLQWPLPTFAQ